MKSLTLGAERWNIKRQSAPSFGTRPSPEHWRLENGGVRPSETSLAKARSMTSWMDESRGEVGGVVGYARMRRPGSCLLG